MLNKYSFVLLKHIGQWASGMAADFIFQTLHVRGQGLSATVWVVHVGQFPCQLPGVPASHERLTHTIGVDIALLFSMWMKASFHPVLDYVVFSLATLIPQSSGKKVFGLLFLGAGIVIIFAIFHVVGVLPGIDYWCTVFCSILLLSNISLNGYIIICLSIHNW